MDRSQPAAPESSRWLFLSALDAARTSANGVAKGLCASNVSAPTLRLGFSGSWSLRSRGLARSATRLVAPVERLGLDRPSVTELGGCVGAPVRAGLEQEHRPRILLCEACRDNTAGSTSSHDNDIERFATGYVRDLLSAL